MKSLMADKLKDVRPSASLKSHPVCITAEGEISIEMEKVLNAMPGNEQKISAQKVLEININHPVFEKLKSADDETLKKGLDIFVNAVKKVMENIYVMMN
jgi:molecular chaperone HtpG